MAFAAAPGYTNLPNGKFSPVIFSKKAQLAFRKTTVVNEITNSDYMGEIAQFGDTVTIIKEPTIQVHPYVRGQKNLSQDLVDEDFTLQITQANYFQFGEDDIEVKQQHVNFMDLAASQAAYALSQQYDSEVLAYMSGYQYDRYTGQHSVNTVVNGTKAIATADDDELLPSMKLSRPSFGNFETAGNVGDSIPLAIRLPGTTTMPTTHISPVMLINRMATKLDQQNVPKEGRFIVIDPVIKELLSDEDSRLLNADWGESGALRNGLVLPKWNGFRVYESNNLPKIGNGPGTNGAAAQSANFGVILAGHSSAVATAEQISKTERMRSPDTFADIMRGLQLYGRKILRPEAIVTARYNVA